MSFRLIQADCIEAMQGMDESSVDAIVTDPPYGLEFMAKEWDSLGRRTNHHMDPSMAITRTDPEKGNPWASEASGYGAPKKNPRCKRCGRLKFDHEPRRCACDVPDFDTRTSEYARVMQTWHHAWAVEALRVLKPGGHLLAFGGCRTIHRLVCAIEDAGFEIRDMLSWNFGSGFPKSLNVSGALEASLPADARCVCGPRSTQTAQGSPADYPSGHGSDDERLPQVADSGQASVPSLADALGHSRDDQHAGGPVSAPERSRPVRSVHPSSEDSPPQATPPVGRSRSAGSKPPDMASSKSPVESTAERRTVDRTPGTSRSGVDWESYGSWDKHISRCRHCGGLKVQPGWGTALKPAWEGITLARKPLIGSVAANVQAFGTGALNIDGCRIGTDGELEQPEGGRWPANVALDTEAAAMLDEQTGELHYQEPGYKGGPPRNRKPKFSVTGFPHGPPAGYDDRGGASRFFYCAKSDREERNRGLGHMPVRLLETHGAREQGPLPQQTPQGPIRAQNTHPTVKPVALMQWLCRLVTPKGGTILDPFTGSGSTGMAACREGFDFIGVEREPEYVEIARARIIGDGPLFNVEGTP